MFMILEVTSVTNVRFYSARNVTSLFKSFHKTCYLRNNITRQITLNLHPFSYPWLLLRILWIGTVTLTTHGTFSPLFRLFSRLPTTETLNKKLCLLKRTANNNATHMI